MLDEARGMQRQSGQGRIQEGEERKFHPSMVKVCG